MGTPRIAIPIPWSTDAAYSQRAWPQYAEALRRCGAEPVPVPLDSTNDEIARIANSCQAFLLPGSGADVNPQKYGQPRDPETADADPARENVDELLLQDAHNMHKPLLCICFGVQMLNVWRTGSLVQHVEDTGIDHRAGREVMEAHPAEVAADSMLGGIVAATGIPEHDHMLTLPVNSSHHQALQDPGDGLRIVARCPVDGVIEAVEGGQHPGHFVLGVQWHPERTFDHSPASRAIFERFVDEARQWKPREIKDSIA